MNKHDEYYREFVILGYSEDKADELATLVTKPLAEFPELTPELQVEIIEALNAIGCTSFRMFPGELRKIL